MAKRYPDSVNGHARPVDGRYIRARVGIGDARVGTFLFFFYFPVLRDRNLAAGRLMTREGCARQRGKRMAGTKGRAFRAETRSREIDERVVKLALETVN